jgi:hypothetical protein
MPGEQHSKTCYRARIGRLPIQSRRQHECSATIGAGLSYTIASQWGADQRANVTKGGLLYPSSPCAAAGRTKAPTAMKLFGSLELDGHLVGASLRAVLVVARRPGHANRI